VNLLYFKFKTLQQQKIGQFYRMSFKLNEVCLNTLFFLGRGSEFYWETNCNDICFLILLEWYMCDEVNFHFVQCYL